MKKILFSIFILSCISITNVLPQEAIASLFDKAKESYETTYLVNNDLKTETIRIHVTDNPDLIKQIKTAFDQEEEKGIKIEKISSNKSGKKQPGQEMVYIALRHKIDDKQITYAYIPINSSDCFLLITKVGSMGKLNGIEFGKGIFEGFKTSQD